MSELCGDEKQLRNDTIDANGVGVSCVGLDWIADSPLPPASEPDAGDMHNELAERIMLVRKMKQNMGRTALMLSGGT